LTCASSSSRGFDAPGSGSAEARGYYPGIAAVETKLHPDPIAAVVDRRSAQPSHGRARFSEAPVDGVAEVGYGIVSSRQRAGFATEAVIVMVAADWSRSTRLHRTAPAAAPALAI
jgi:hypothetical protein